MNGTVSQVCRLCFNIIEKEFPRIDLVRDIFSILSIQVNLDFNKSYIVCWNCTKLLKNLCLLKLTWMNVEKTIHSFAVNKEDVEFDMKAVTGNLFGDFSHDFDLCRFCMKQTQTDNYISMDTLGKNMGFADLIPLLLPEMDFSIIKNPVICTPCIANLKIYFNIILKLLDIEEKIDNPYHDCGWTLEICNLGVHILNDPIGYQSNAKKHENTSFRDTTAAEDKLKTEALDIQDEDLISYKSEQEIEKKDDNLINESFAEYSLSQSCVKRYDKSRLKIHMVSLMKQSEARIYQCKKCDFKTKYELRLTSHMVLHRNFNVSPTKMYQCEDCGYLAEEKQSVKIHMLVHDDIPDTLVCTECKYQAKEKRHLRQHMLSHKDPCRTLMYVCTKCTFKTRKRQTLQLHIACHESTFPKKEYKCGICNFETEHERTLQVHLEGHRKILVTREPKEKTLENEKNLIDKSSASAPVSDVGEVLVTKRTTRSCSTVSMRENYYDSSSKENISNFDNNTTNTNDSTKQIPNTACYVKPEVNADNQPTKKESLKVRPIVCPICFIDVPSLFTRHLLRNHGDNKDVKLLKSFKPRSVERLRLVALLKKQGNFHLKVEKGILNPMRKSNNVDYFVCTHCLGKYSKKLLYRHVKRCKNKPPDIKTSAKNCLSKSRNHGFLKSSRIKTVFNIMRPDEISEAAKNDPLICLYGERLLNKRYRRQNLTMVSNKIREMARLLIALRSVNPGIDTLFDALKPELFEDLVTACKKISGFNAETKTFKSPSLALHIGTNLRIVCDVAFRIVVEKKSVPKLRWANGNGRKKEIKEIEQRIRAYWCNELSSLALKNLKEKQCSKTRAAFNRVPQITVQASKMCTTLYKKDVTADCNEDSNSLVISEPHSKSARKECSSVNLDKSNRKGIGKRARWTEPERKLVLKHFQQHIKRKVTPRKRECEKLISKHKNILKDKDWVKVKTYVYNAFREK